MLGNKLIYAACLVLVVAYAILYNEYSSMIFLIMIVWIPIVLFLFLIPTAMFVRLSHCPCKTVAAKGEEIIIPIQAENRSVLPVSMIKVKIVFHNEFEKKKQHTYFKFSLDARESRRLECKIISQCCGNIYVTVKGYRVYDYLHLFSLGKRLNEEIKFAVLPGIYEMEPFVLQENINSLAESDIYSKTKSGDDPSEVFDIRPYREGDKIHRIHWKLSYKKGDLMVKEYSRPISCSVLILLELYYDGKNKSIASYIDGLFETALSLSFALIQNGNTHYIGFYDNKNKECKRKKVKEEADIFEVLEELINLVPYKSETPLIPLHMAVYEMEQYSHIFYISTHMKKEVLEELAGTNNFTKIHALLVTDVNKHSKKNENEKLKEELEKMRLLVDLIDTGCVSESVAKILIES